MTTTTAPITQHTEPKETGTMFVFNKDYDDHEQVRPFFADYLTVRASLAGFPYNDSFRGLIPGIQGPSEDTAIYMLQCMHSRDEMMENVAAFRDSGAVDPSEIPLGVTIRADVATWGFYVGGTDWKLYSNGRFTRYGDRHGNTFIPKGKRHGLSLRSSNLLVLVTK